MIWAKLVGCIAAGVVSTMIVSANPYAALSLAYIGGWLGAAIRLEIREEAE